MATGPQQKRKELREKRLKAEAEAKRADKRQDMGKIVGAIAGVVVLAVVVVVVLSITGSDDKKSGGSESSASVEKLLKGIPQSGTLLGDPKAKVTLVEFADLQCPACQQYAEQVLPDIISGPVKDGTANFDLHQWTILGPDSTTAAYAAYAAAEQNRYWQFIENFYANQGQENAGYVTDEFLTDIAEKAGVPDLDKWNEDRADESRWEKQLTETDNKASDLGLTGTPGFAIQVDGGELQQLEDTGSAEAINKALEKAAKQAG
ncbi:MAG: thioredoxin domain-containing protein [Solirubrobacterales bacterium]|nr:thioredoxin domain-containing protein [Solirubrobacterales bacterium]